VGPLWSSGSSPAGDEDDFSGVHQDPESLIPFAVKDTWMDIEIGGVTSRADLKSGLTRLGGPGADVVIPGAPEGELHFWSDPPKLVHVSGQTPLEVAGSRKHELELKGDEAVVWGRVTLRYHGAAAVLEEIPIADSEPPAPSRAAGSSSDGGRAWSRVQAGIAVELGMADKSAVKRWQEAVLRNEFDADACSREVLAGGGVSVDDPRVVERAGRLLRDFLMSGLQRGVKGAGRKVRAQARSGTAYVVANLIAISVYTAIVMVVMVLARLKWDISFDGAIDFILGRG
jgi:hypothetical protein